MRGEWKVLHLYNVYLFYLISLIFIHLFHFLHGVLEERPVKTIRILTSQNMGWILSNTNEMKEIHQLLLSTMMSQTSMG